MGWNARKPKTLQKEIQPYRGGGDGKERGDDVCFQEIQSLELWRAREDRGEGRGKGRRRARFLVYRGINPYPQLPFVLGAAWSTC